jgi:ribosome-associated protein
MNQTEKLVKTIIKGLQDKKGKNIVEVDLAGMEGAMCDYMLISEGSSPTQVSALSDSVWDLVRKEAGEKPLSVEGYAYAHWIGMDYGSVLVHIFLPDERAFYNLENLWADSTLRRIADMD